MEKTINQVKSLKFKQLEGTVNFEIHDKEEIIFEYDNKDVIIETSGSKAIVKSIHEESNNGYNVTRNINGGIQVSGNCSNISISNGKVFINGKEVNPTDTTTEEVTKVNMTIKLPRDMIKKIDVECPLKLTMGDITYKLDLALNCQSSAYINDVQQLNIESSGQVKGVMTGIMDLSIDCSGQSNFVLKESKRIGLDLSGQCHICIHNETLLDNLEIDASGMSRIDVRGKVDVCECDLSGMCEVIFEEKPNDLTVDKSGMSKVIYL